LPQFHFYRFEFKYILSESQYRSVRGELLVHMDHDPIVRESAEQSYVVSSLYCDTPNFSHYREKIDGVKNRLKLRFRTYTLNPRERPPIFLEIKRKKDAAVIKDRALIDYESYLQMEADGYNVLLRNGRFSLDQKSLIEEFCWHFLRWNMSPRVRVVYSREPLLARHDRHFRVTLDRKIFGSPADRLFSTYGDRCPALPGLFVMEVKFNGLIPAWFHAIIQRHGLSRVPASKYCEAVKACNLY